MNGAADSTSTEVTARPSVDEPATQREARHQRIDLGHAQTPPTRAASSFVTATPAMKRLLGHAEKIAKYPSNVLITGESGTGKSTIARMIHQTGPRASKPFVEVNCGALPRDLMEAELFGHKRGAFTGATSDRTGRVEMANGGTLFLDKIGDLPLELQSKLLHFLQDRTIQRVGSDELQQVDVRVIAATNQPLAEMCQEKRFREDLFFRLSVLSLPVPSLRENRAAIPDLVQTILQRIAKRHQTLPYLIDDESMDTLMRHNWPGNVREMETVLERACVFATRTIITKPDLVFDSIRSTTDVGDSLSQFCLAGKTLGEIEKQAITETLEFCGGNKAKSARNLGISERSMYNKLRRHELLCS